MVVIASILWLGQDSRSIAARTASSRGPHGSGSSVTGPCVGELDQRVVLPRSATRAPRRGWGRRSSRS